MLKLSFTEQFKKDYKKAKKQGRDILRLEEVFSVMQQGRNPA